MPKIARIERILATRRDAATLLRVNTGAYLISTYKLLKSRKFDINFAQSKANKPTTYFIFGNPSTVSNRLKLHHLFTFCFKSSATLCFTFSDTKVKPLECATDSLKGTHAPSHEGRLVRERVVRFHTVVTFTILTGTGMILLLKYYYRFPLRE